MGGGRARNIAEEKEMVAVNEEKMYTDSGSDNVVEVIAKETISAPAARGGATVHGLTPEYDAGETRKYEIKISNSVVGIPSLVGSTVSLAGKTATAQAVAEAVTKKLGENFIPGLNLVAWILATAAFVNEFAFGNSGFLVTITLEYVEMYWHREDITAYSWRPDSLSLGV